MQKSGSPGYQSPAQTFGYALADSPSARLRGSTKSSASGPHHFAPEREISPTRFSPLSLYWLTLRAAAVLPRLYYDSFGTDFSTQSLDLPSAVSLFPGANCFYPPRLWARGLFATLLLEERSRPRRTFRSAFEQPAVFSRNCGPHREPLPLAGLRR